MSMTFLFISCLAESIGLAIRIKSEGHRVLYYIHSEVEKDCGDGFLEKVTNWREAVKDADVIFFDDVDQKQKDDTAFRPSVWAAQIRKDYPDKIIIHGGPKEISDLENDRMYATEILQQYGLPTVPMERFTSFQDAVKFVQENGGAWALKHNSQVDRDLAHVSKDPDDMIEFLNWLDENWAELGNGQPVDFVLQQTVEGIEFAITAFFDGVHFRAEACYLNQEEKKELNSGYGRSTGQMGEIGFMLPNPRLFQQTLLKLEPFFYDKNYVGFVDLNCIITGSGDQDFVPLEFTVNRPGYPTVDSWCELLAEPVGDWLVRMAKRDTQLTQVYDAMECTVVIATGTFPDQHQTRNKTAILRGLDKTGLRHVWLGEVRWKDGKIYGAGDSGYMCVITSKADSIPEAAIQAYDIADKIDVVPYKKIRTDIGIRAVKEFPLLYEWGWLK